MINEHNLNHTIYMDQLRYAPNFIPLMSTVLYQYHETIARTQFTLSSEYIHTVKSTRKMRLLLRDTNTGAETKNGRI